MKIRTTPGLKMIWRGGASGLAAIIALSAGLSAASTPDTASAAVCTHKKDKRLFIYVTKKKQCKKANGRRDNQKDRLWRPGKMGLGGPEGPRGSIGPIGPVGPEGPPGPAGTESSVAGPPGPRGETGPAGPRGEAGPEGPQGEPGPEGPQGLTGGFAGLRTVTNTDNDGDVEVNCPGGEVASGGGGTQSVAPPKLILTESRPLLSGDIPTGWRIEYAGSGQVLTVFAICGPIAAPGD